MAPPVAAHRIDNPRHRRPRLVEATVRVPTVMVSALKEVEPTDSESATCW